MATGTVAADVRALLREWDDSGDGALWLQFQTDGDQAAAFVALARASFAADNACSDPDPDGRDEMISDGPAVTAKGPTVFIQQCPSAEMLERWTSVLVAELDHEGWQGRLRPVRTEDTPYDGPGKRVNCVTAGLVLSIDQRAVEAVRRRPGRAHGWNVSDEYTRQVIDRAADFCLGGEGDVYFKHQNVQFRVAAADVPRLLSTAISRGPVTSLTRIGPQGSVHRVVLYELGHVIYEFDDPDADGIKGAQHLTEVVRSHVSIAEYALVRLSWSPAVGWEDVVNRRPPRLPRVPAGYHRRAPHLESSWVPDAYGVQLLTDRHLRHANDLSAWNVEEVAPGKHLVVARDPGAWFGPSEPDATVVEHARGDFGPMILEEAQIRTGLR